MRIDGAGVLEMDAQEIAGLIEVGVYDRIAWALLSIGVTKPGDDQPDGVLQGEWLGFGVTVSVVITPPASEDPELAAPEVAGGIGGVFDAEGPDVVGEIGS